MKRKTDKNSILLVAVNSRYTHSNPSLFIFKKILETDFPGKVRLLESTIKEKPEDIITRIMAMDPRPVHILFSVYIWNSELVNKTVPLLKQIHPTAHIVLGGPEITYNTSFWDYSGGADVLVTGPGEKAITSVILGEHTGKIVQGPTLDLNLSPFPYTESDLELLKGRMIYYESSRGCPFNCSYCQSACSGQDLEFRDLDLVKKELKILARSSVRMVKFVDRSFNCRPERARQIWKYILTLQSRCSFHFEIHPLYIQEEDIKILKEVPSHLFHLEVGIQSSSNRVLEAVNRKSSWKDIRDKISTLIRETSVPIHVDQIVGLPEADYSSVTNSFNDIFSLRAEEFQMGFLKCLPGTPLEKQYGQTMTVLPYPPYNVMQTATLSFTEIQRLHRIEDILNTYGNSGLFRHTMSLLLFSREALYPGKPFTFFSELLNLFPSEERIKGRQWASLCSTLMEFCRGIKPEIQWKLIDALRIDWSLLSQGQYAPPAIAYPVSLDIKRVRKELWESFSSCGISKSLYNKSYLVILEDTDRIFDYLLSVPMEDKRQLYSLKNHNDKAVLWSEA